jgi:beta-phosphoglucomutase family hydrolase
MGTTKAFIFDMDGTLVDNMRFHTRAWTTLLAEVGIDIDPDQFVRETAGLNNSDVLRQLIGPVITEEEIAEFSKRKERLYRRLYDSHVEAIAGAHEFLLATQDRGIPMALATAAGAENIEFILSRLGIKALFSAIVSSENLANGKPHPEIFLKAAEALGVAPESCLVFEDSPLGIEAARRAGMEAILIATSLTGDQLEGYSNIRRIIKDYEGLEIATMNLNQRLT